MEIRRVVTATGGNGRSYVSKDDFERAPTGSEDVVRIWATTTMPPEVDGPDRTLEEWELQPPPMGINWQLVVHPPGKSGTRMHKTSSVDLIFMLSGELFMRLDEEEVRLTAHDTVIQRETVHAWENRGTEPAVMLVTMISTRP